RWHELQQPLAIHLLERLSQRSYSYPENTKCSIDREPRPQLIDDPIGTEYPAVMYYKQSQKTALFRGSRCHVEVVDQHLQRTKNIECTRHRSGS
ncbi:MAG: hypothetical protein QOJ19_4592, partial [Acidimicrobiia bacterium]|nr:hypothetical protein [Acidimicrobiia bacterium]